MDKGRGGLGTDGPQTAGEGLRSTVLPRDGQGTGSAVAPEKEGSVKPPEWGGDKGLLSGWVRDPGQRLAVPGEQPAGEH